MALTEVRQGEFETLVIILEPRQSRPAMDTL